MDRQGDPNDLILEIYDTAIEPDRWPAVLTRVAGFVGARGAFIFALDRAGPGRRIRAPFFSDTYEPSLVEAYLAVHNAQELADQDEFARMSRLTDAIELIADDVLAPSEAELLERPNVREMLRYGLRFRAGALLNKDQVDEDRFAVQFSSDIGAISAEHHRRAALVMPHLAKALNVGRPLAQLAHRHRSVVEGVDRLLIGVCVLDANGSIVFANQEFERQLDRYRVFRRDPAGRLLMQGDGTSRAFARLTAGPAGHGRFGARPRKEAIVTEADGEPHTLCIEVTPLRRADALGESDLSGHVVYSMDTGNPYAIDAGVLADLFTLTGAEASVLELMAEGLTNAQISDRRSKSVETVNSQVRSILDKTGSANRTQAIRLAASISSAFLAEAEDAAPPLPGRGGAPHGVGRPPNAGAPRPLATG